MADYAASRLKREQCLAIVVSTHGEGDPPDDAAELHGFLGSRRRPDLCALHFRVLARGDSSYEHFCRTGRDFDERLAAAGATRLADLAECDVDYETVADTWQDSVLDRAVAIIGETGRAPTPARRRFSPRSRRRSRRSCP
jgi:sulfite reductase (NADPH) flavoprotein alpha-component